MAEQQLLCTPARVEFGSEASDVGAALVTTAFVLRSSRAEVEVVAAFARI